MKYMTMLRKIKNVCDILKSVYFLQKMRSRGGINFTISNPLGQVGNFLVDDSLIFQNEFIIRNYIRYSNNHYVYEDENIKILTPPYIINADKVMVNDLREIIFNSVYEYGTVHIAPGDFVIDCGANIGIFTVIAGLKSKSTAKVFSFEPECVCYERLIDNIRINNLINITPIKLALSNKEGNVKLIKNPSVFTMHYIDEKKTRFYDRNHFEEVNAISIDQFIKEYDLKHVDFIKMDIEGAELRALEGAKHTLRNFMPKLAISLYHKHDHCYKIPLQIKMLNSKYKITISRRYGGTIMCYAAPE